MQDWNNDIERYKSGEMTSSEMHALERKALSDPFLADALHGIEAISTEEFAKDITELNKQLIGRQKKILWTPLKIAAGIILVIGAGFIFYRSSAPKRQPQLMASKSENKKSDSVISLEDTVSKKKELLTLNEPLEKQDRNEQTEKPKAQQELALLKPSPPIKTEPPVQVADVIAEAKQSPEVSEVKAEEELNPQPQIAEEQRSEVRSTLREITLDKKEAKRKSVNPSYTAGAVAAQSARIITGQVTSAEDGAPLPGVNVVIKGTTKGTITDEEGNYSIELGTAQNPQLVFSFIGAYSTEVPVDDQSNINTQLKNDVSQLSEVVVVGYGTDNGVAADEDFPTLQIAEPNGGRRAFKKYLETNLQYPQQALENKVEGKVTVQFTVNTEGTLNDFKVIKGIGSGCDDEVIRLIKSGPKWYPSRKGDSPVDSRMRVRMRFKLP